MNPTTFLTLCLAAFLTCFSAKTTRAQNQPSIESISQAHFQQLSFDQKKVMIYSWVNKSQNAIISSDFEFRAKEYYTKQLQDEHGYGKHIVFFRTLFNETLHSIDRINFCNFLVDNFSEEDIPLSLIRETKDSLIRSTIK